VTKSFPERAAHEFPQPLVLGFGRDDPDGVAGGARRLRLSTPARALRPCDRDTTGR
jgi:hypothetical protein